jgi:glycosyltransferase involved in cell wall biosynthesis
VTFLGYVEDLPRFIQGVRVFAVPLRYGGGLRIRLVEALTVGAAVVSTPVGASGLELTPDVHFVEAETAPAFARALVRVLADDELRQRLVREGREEAVRRYGRESVRQKTVELFESLARRRTAA